MSYNMFDEVSSQLESQITRILGGRTWIIDEDGCEVSVCPFNASDKGTDEIIRFNNIKDFNKVLEVVNDENKRFELEAYYVNNNRLIVANKNKLEMRFKLN